MNQNPFGGQDPFEYLRRQMEEQLRQKQRRTSGRSNSPEAQTRTGKMAVRAVQKMKNRNALIPTAIL